MTSWVIVVDDDVTNLKMAGQILSKHNMRVIAVKSGQALLDYVSDDEHGFPDLVLLDINMPQMDGFETYERFRALEGEKHVPATPVVMLTADEDMANESKGFEMGVSDYIRKPFDPDVLVRRVNNIISTRGRMLKYEEEATIDKLTGFLNKYNANEHIAEMCRTKQGTMMIVDLDSFKLVNDIYGHDMGDRVLAKFSQILKDNMMFPTVFGRIGGDEFLMFAENLKEEKEIAKYSDAINRSLISEARLMMGEDMSIPLGASIGAIFIPEQGTDFNELFRLSDRALYTIKNNGKHGYSLYIDDDDTASAIPSDINLSMLTTILEERNIPQNAMWMGKEAFGNVYRYMIRYMDRYRGTAYKMLFTAKFVPKDLSQSEKQKIMLRLRELLQESLRNSDIMMQIGDNHFFLMLPEISDYNVSRVTERVMSAWKSNEYSGLVNLTVETESTDSDMHEGSGDGPEGEGVIMVVDDDDSERDLIVRSLSAKGLKIEARCDGKSAIEYLDDFKPDLIVMRASMNGMNGTDILVEIRKMGGALRRIPTILILNDDSFEKRALELGVSEFIRMPVSDEQIYIRVNNVLQLTRLKDHLSREAEKKAEEFEKLSIHIIKALAYAIDAKDKYTNGHSSRVANYSRMIAEKYGYTEEQQNEIYIIGLLHDVGKIGIPDAIINKNTRLSDEEYEIIKTHPVIGTQILSSIKEMPNLINGARWHHERYDGTGYPDKKAGEDIPEVARIISVADAYDAMTSHRSYRDTLPQDKVREELIRCRGTQFDPVFADIMVDIMDNDKDYTLREE